MRGDESQKDQNCFCKYHKDKGHAIEECRHFHYLVERMVQVEQLSKYLHNRIEPFPARQDAPTFIIDTEARQVIHVIHRRPIDG